MRALIQRVSMAKVTVDNQILGQIQKGLLILLGITHGDTEEKAAWLAEKAASLRVFPDASGKMNLDLVESGGHFGDQSIHPLWRLLQRSKAKFHQRS